MSKFAVPLLTLAAVGLGAVSVVQYQQSAEERRQIAALTESLAKEKANTSEIEKELARLREQNVVYQSESEQLRRKLAAAAAGGGVTGDAVTKVSASGAAPEEAKEKKPDFMQAMAKMFTDPEMKKAMRGQQAMGMRMMYSDLAKEIALSPEEADQVMEILTDRQLAITGKSMAMFGDAKGDDKKMEEAGKAMNESRAEFDKQLEGVLGSDRYGKFQEYEGTMGERVMLNQLQQQFTSRGMNLEDTQKKDLLQIMVDERKAMPPSPFSPANKDVAAQLTAMKSEDTMNRLIDQQKQLNARVADRARTVLSPDQVNALQSSQAQMLEMQQFGIKMSKQMMGK